MAQTPLGKPLALLAVEAADEARCDVLSELGKVKPIWKAAQESRDKAEEDLLDAQTAARERFPEGPYDTDTSNALNARTGEYETRTAKFRRLDSRKRSLDDKIKKLTTEVLRLLGEMREPGLWAAGQALGPDGWKQLKLRTLCGGPDPDKDMDKQTWLTQELETAGYHTLDEFLKGRGRLIAAAMDNVDFAPDTVKAVDREVYRYLERKGLLKYWPKDVDVPAGEQFLLDSDDETQTLLDTVAEEPQKPKKAKPESSSGGLKLVGGSADDLRDKYPPLVDGDLLALATGSKKDGSVGDKEAAGRIRRMLDGWADICARHLDPDELVSEKQLESFGKVFGGSPAALLQRVANWMSDGATIPQSPVMENITERIMSCMMAEIDDLAGERDGKTDEVTAAFIERAAATSDRGAAMATFTAFGHDFATHFGRVIESAAKPKQPNKTGKKPATKKTTKKTGKKPATTKKAARA